MRISPRARQRSAMPEGPEIRRAADRLARALGRDAAVRVQFAFDHLKGFEATLNAAPIRAFETRGKALLTRFANGWTVYSHNQLYGRWQVAKPGERPATTRQLRLAIDGERASLLLYSASDIEVLRDDALADHPFLAKLGPDLLSEKPSVAQLIERLQSPRFCGRALGALLLDQSFVAGLGNYLRAEVLFRARIAPDARAKSLSATARECLAHEILATTVQAYRHRSITNDLDRADALKRDGYRFEQYRFHVFDRAGLDCYTCGDTIVRTVSGGRRMYHCPTCQATP
jgi:endonuclease VIII